VRPYDDLKHTKRLLKSFKEVSSKVRAAEKDADEIMQGSQAPHFPNAQAFDASPTNKGVLEQAWESNLKYTEECTRKLQAQFKLNRTLKSIRNSQAY
jgi:hypothetical protein